MTNEAASAIAALNQTLRQQIARMDSAFDKVELLSRDISAVATAIHDLNVTLSENLVNE